MHQKSMNFHTQSFVHTHTKTETERGQESFAHGELMLLEGEEGCIKTDDALFSTRSNTTDSHILKPLLIGSLTGQFQALLSHWIILLGFHVNESHDDPILKKRLPPDVKTAKRMLRINLLFRTTHTTASLGVFQVLTQKLRTTNNGRPLSLYQEVCCGLTSGATAALLSHPIFREYSRAAPHYNLSYGNLFSNLCHVVRDKGAFALWKGSGKNISMETAAIMGMLVSYDRSKNYLMESKGLSEGNAQIGGGIMSGFFAAACGHPLRYVKAIKDGVQKQYHLGDKHYYRSIPVHISQILTPYSGFKFYSGFLKAFGRCGPLCMVQWYIFEHIRMLEESMASQCRRLTN